MGNREKRIVRLEDLSKEEIRNEFLSESNDTQDPEFIIGSNQVFFDELLEAVRQNPEPALLPSGTWSRLNKSSGTPEIHHLGLRLEKFLILNRKVKSKLSKTNFEKWTEFKTERSEKYRKILLSDQLLAANELVSDSGLYCIELSNTWRLAIGLGNESVLETSMTLHHTYGFPYIPGQALKGAIRNYVISMNFISEQEALKDKDFCNIFGGGEGAAIEKSGSVMFFDAFPTAEPKIMKDIMNPHFSPYYSGNGNKPPGDYYDPVPVTFLTVNGTSFRFMAGLKRGREWKLENNRIGTGDMKTVVGEWIEKSLSIFGIGAKTSVGYGRFE